MTPKEAIDYLLDPIGKRDKHDEAVKLAVDALEKQIPMKTLAPESDAVTGKIIHPCGNCGDDPGWGEYCQWCGQRIER